jgi:VWFA-related protein
MNRAVATGVSMLAVCVVAALAAQPATPQPEVTLRVRVDQVAVDVVVTDARGAVVAGLTKEDFDVEDDGDPQVIASFTSVSQDYDELGAAQDATVARPTSVRSNRQIAEARIYALVLDDANVGLEMSAAVQDAARRFVERYLGPHDLAAIVSTTGMGRNQEFTTDRTRLNASIAQFVGRKQSNARAQMDSAQRAADRDPMGSRRVRATGRSYGAAETEVNAVDAEQSRDMLVAVDTLRNVSAGLASAENRRKAVVLFSNGFDYSYRGLNRDRSAEIRTTIAAAARANVAIYGVDVRGLHSKGSEAMDLRALPPLESDLSLATLQGDRLLEADSLTALSEETGGVASLDSNDLDQAFTRIVARNSVYYILGYSPAKARADGRFHSIRVRVKRPELRVSARKGYVAEKDGKPERAPSRAREASARTAVSDPGASVSPDLVALLRRALPAGPLRLDVQPVAFVGGVDNVTLVIELAGSDLTFAERDGLATDTVDIGMLPVGPTGPTGAPIAQRVRLALDREAHQAAGTHGVRFTPTLSLAPGRYQLRVAVHESGGSKLGSVLCDVEVPSAPSRGLLMTDVALSATAATSAHTVQREQTLTRALAGPPTTRRGFARAETLTFYSEIYDAASLRPHEIDVTTIVTDAAGAERVRSVEPRANRALAGENGGFGYVASIPLRSLRPGRHVLRVEARSGRPDVPPAIRELAFDVVP